MASHGWLSRVFGTEGGVDRPPKRKEPSALKTVARVEKRVCGNCANAVGIAAHRCPHCGYRLAQPTAPCADDRPGRREPDASASTSGLDESGTPVAIPLPLGVAALTRASGA
jgi:ribosomal protein L40E